MSDRARRSKRQVYECTACGDETSDIDAFLIHAHLHLVKNAKQPGGKRRHSHRKRK